MLTTGGPDFLSFCGVCMEASKASSYSPVNLGNVSITLHLADVVILSETRDAQ